MKTNGFLKTWLTVGLMSGLFFTSCKHSPEDTVTPETPAERKYGLWVTATDGSYILTTGDLMKDTLLTPANNQGVDITSYLPAAYYGVYAYCYNGYYYLSADGTRFSQYEITDAGRFSEVNNYAFSSTFYIGKVAANLSSDDELVFTATSGKENTEENVLEQPIYFMNTNTMTMNKTLIAKLPFLDYTVKQANGEPDDLYMVPTSMTIRNDKVFFGYKFRSNINYNDVIDTAFIYVCDYPGMENGKLLKDTRGGKVAGHWQVNSTSFVDDNGDLYLLTQNLSSKYGLIRIKSGETEIDPGYFFNLGDYNIFQNGSSQIQLLGEGRAYISPFVINPSQQKIVADLRILTDAIPRTTMNFVEDGKLYDVFKTSDSKWYVYEYDPATNTVKKGAEIDSGVSWVYHVNRLK
ncbi:MAG: hypothetical protein KF862_09210 [Chitinophagaceae bacterium]|nr:hypothetical protein [Chitinophagaceae bacterium]